MQLESHVPVPIQLPSADQLPSRSSASLSKGVWFVFRDGEDDIRAWGSCWTGLERVYFNEHIVVNSVKRNQRYQFQMRGDHYQVDFSVLGAATGKITCSLFKNHRLITTYFSRRKKILNARPALLHMNFAFAAGLLGGALQLPPIYTLLFISTSFLVTLLNSAKSDGFTIEEA